MTHDKTLSFYELKSLLSEQQKKWKTNTIELLALSVCESAKGSDQAPLGLSGAAIDAGAKSVLGALWPVNDEAAKYLMPIFYRKWLVEGKSKSEALAGAQRAFIESKEQSKEGIPERFKKPYYWAPFVLVGEW